MEHQNKIASLRFSVQVDDAARAFAVRQYLNRDWEAELQTVVDQSVSDLEHEHGWHYLNKLEVKLQLQDIEQLPEKLFQALTLQLGKKLAAGQVNQANELSKGTRDRFTTKSNETQAEPDVQSRVEEQSGLWTTTDVVLFYLLNGRKPWFIETSEFTATVKTTTETELTQILRHAEAIGRPVSWVRLVDLLVTHEVGDWQSTLLQHLVAPTDALRGIYSELLTALCTDSRMRSDPSRDVVTSITVLSWFIKPAICSRTDLSALLKLPGLDHAEWQTLLQSRHWSQDQQSALDRDIPPGLTQSYSQAPQQVESQADAEALNPASVVPESGENISSVSPDRANRPNQAQQAATQDPSVPPESPDEFANGELLENAGLVLLAPFIGRLFEHCGIGIEKGKIVYEQLSRAAALLLAAANGRHRCHEYELGMIKVLLGVDLESPIPMHRSYLEDEDRVQVEDLLKAAIGHWDALGETSTDGLRQSFLIRPALLKEKDNYYTLDFERLGHDVLIDRIPWSIQMVKFPWMQKPINVNW